MSVIRLSQPLGYACPTCGVFQYVREIRKPSREGFMWFGCAANAAHPRWRIARATVFDDMEKQTAESVK
jgi:hypothetical protein